MHGDALVYLTGTVISRGGKPKTTAEVTEATPLPGHSLDSKDILCETTNSLSLPAVHVNKKKINIICCYSHNSMFYTCS